MGKQDFAAAALRGLADLARYRQDDEEALSRYTESLCLQRELAAGIVHKIASERGGAECAACLQGLAAMVCAEGQAVRAARLLGAAEALREAGRAFLAPAEQADLDGIVAAVRAALAETDLAAAWAEGRAMSLEQALAYAQTEGVEGEELKVGVKML